VNWALNAALIAGIIPAAFVGGSLE
jgi:hypothetical protein